MTINLDAIRARYASATLPRSSWSYASASADDVPTLIAEVERLRDELDAVREVEVRRLALKPGDVIVLGTDRPIDNRTADEMRARATEWFPGHDVRVISGASMAIVEPTDGGAS